MSVKVRPVLRNRDIEALISEYPQYRDCLFARGYLLTNDQNIDPNEYPFYGEWKKATVYDYTVLVHKDETFFFADENDQTFLLIGHAYNPISMKWDENELIKDCAQYFESEQFFSIINEWTGAFALFVIDHSHHRITGLTDATSMKMCNYTYHDAHYYISSHSQLLADILNLPMTSYAERIRKTKMYNTGMRWLPGNTTAYETVFRLGANLYAQFIDGGHVKTTRFYPIKPHPEINTQEQYDDYVERIYQLLHNNLLLCTKKWEKPAISLTGGMDSGCTYACTKGITDSFKIFSFDCKDQERLDSEAAKEICKRTGTEHYQIYVSRNNNEIPDYGILCEIVDHNTSYVMNLSEEEVRKIIVLHSLNEFDVELKSDIAEIGRTFYDRKYGMKMPKVFNARQIAILQTRFFFMPKLQKETEDEYQKYLTSSGIERPLFNYEHSDLIYWEYRIGLAAASCTLSMGMAHTMTFPYNNRALLELFLAFPHKMREQDYPQQSIMERKMPEMICPEAKVEDRYFGKYRILLEKVFFLYKSILRL